MTKLRNSLTPHSTRRARHEKNSDCNEFAEKNGNSEVLAQNFAEGVKAAGNEVNFIADFIE